MSITFSNIDTDVKLTNEALIVDWILKIIANHGYTVGKINYMFCSDEYIHENNVRYLNHDTYTDIITFDYTVGKIISGDILISIERVGENAGLFGQDYEDELHRVIIHGVLHLLGFKDKSDVDAVMMRGKERDALLLLDTMN